MSVVVTTPGPRFRVQLDHDEDDGLYYVRCLDLQGCHSFGKTRQEALDNIREAIAGHLAVSLHVVGKPTGKSSQVIEFAA